MFNPPTIHPPNFGTGHDGVLTFDGVTTVAGIAPSSNIYTLTKDLFGTNVNVSSGVTVFLAGFILRWTGVLTGSGRITAGANNAVTSIAGAGFSSVGTLSTSSGTGGNGKNTTGAGNNAGGSGGNNVAGSSGGAGGQADGSNAGGAGNNSSAPTATVGTIYDIGYLYRRRISGTTAANGTGGGGGGGCNVGAGTAVSGGGGGAGIVGVVAGNIINWTGTLDADGGNGANASGITADGKGGGGGGGGGGAIWYHFRNVINLGTVRANGGTAGAGSGGGSNGVDGTPGTIYRFVSF